MCMYLIDSVIVSDEDVSQSISVENGVMRVNIGNTAYIVDGFTVQIVCKTTNECSVTFSWRRNGKDDQTRGNVPMIIVTDANHGDVFTCVAKNVFGFTDSKETKIIFIKQHFCIWTL